VQINLAGYNVEAEILESLNTPEDQPLTPETFSSAYARISRSSKDVTALRKQARADVHKARKSNQRIIFQMGHYSVAEHAVFNFDIIDVSRLALEELEKFRLVSYTEKSQRYVTLDGDFIIPKEIDDQESIQLFKDTIDLQNQFYFKAFDVLREYLFEKYPELVVKKANKRMVEGWAKEDARYILSLATQGQLGMTINARNLEHLFRRFALSQRKEVQEIGTNLYNLVEKIAPSLILFPEPSAFESTLVSKDFKSKLLNFSASHTDNFANPRLVNNDIYRLKILNYSQDADDRILAAFIGFHKGIDFQEAQNIASHMPLNEKEAIFKGLFQHSEFFDSPPREFELPDIIFQAVVSASNFAQLKRHRMATLISDDYHPDWGIVVPENIRITGLENEFRDIIDKTNNTYSILKGKHGAAADYILTNSHCRRVVMKLNMREMFHFSRLRADQHAQWDIRNLAHKLTETVKELMPLSAMLLCGKSDYVDLYERIYDCKPKFLI
jgi:flavin-dependent thymidylate synthase